MPFLPNGTYTPALRERGWGEEMNDNLAALDAHYVSKSHRDLASGPAPTLFVDVNGLDPGDTGFDAVVAGVLDYPYRSFKEAIESIPGWNTSGVAPFNIVARAGLASATPAQTFELVEQILLPRGCLLDLGDGFNTGTGVTGVLLKDGTGYPATDALVRLGGPASRIKGGLLTNSVGRGVEVGGSAQLATVDGVGFKNCADDAIYKESNSGDVFVVKRARFEGNERDIHLAPNASDAAPNATFLEHLWTAGGNDCSFLFEGGTGSSGRGNLIVLRGVRCHGDHTHIRSLGFNMIHWLDGYCEWSGGTALEPRMELRDTSGTADGSSALGQHLWTKAVTIENIYFNGSGIDASFPANTGRIIHGHGAAGVHLSKCRIASGDTTTSNPLVYSTADTRAWEIYFNECRRSGDDIYLAERAGFSADWLWNMLGTGHRGDYFDGTDWSPYQ
jgi:hypothetical protein